VSTTVFSQTLEQCEHNLAIYKQVSNEALLGMEELEAKIENKDLELELIDKKIALLYQRIERLQKVDVNNEEIISLLEQNEEICLATESQAYDLMMEIMEDYEIAVKEATRPWFLDGKFYGGLVAGALTALLLL
jgi:hypothetical protein